MKKLFLTSICAFSVSQAQATTTFTASVGSLSFGDIPNSTLILDNGSQLTNGTGVVGIGFFDVVDTSTASTSELINNFTLFGSTDTVNNDNGVDGFLDITTSATIDDMGVNSQFHNETIGLLIGNGADFMSSTRFAAVEFNGLVFLDNDELNSGESVILTDMTTTLLIGNDTGAFDYTAFSNNFTSDSISLVAVPEPSSTALLGLGTVGFLLRRRR